MDLRINMWIFSERCEVPNFLPMDAVNGIARTIDAMTEEICVPQQHAVQLRLSQLYLSHSTFVSLAS